MTYKDFIDKLKERYQLQEINNKQVYENTWHYVAIHDNFDVIVFLTIIEEKKGAKVHRFETCSNVFYSGVVDLVNYIESILK